MADERIQNDQQKQSFLEQALAKRQEWAAEQPSVGAEVRAMGREAIKDVRSTINEIFFGKPEHFPEPGTPLNPTPQMVTQDLGTQEGYRAMLDGYAAQAAPKPPERGMDR